MPQEYGKIHCSLVGVSGTEMANVPRDHDAAGIDDLDRVDIVPLTPVRTPLVEQENCCRVFLIARVVY